MKKTAEQKLADLFNEPNCLVVAYKLNLMCLDDVVRGLYKIVAPKTNRPTSEICKILGITESKDYFDVEYCVRKIKNGKYWKE